MGDIEEFFLILIVMAAVVCDWRTYRIPNTWILLGYLCAFLFLLKEGISGAGEFTMGMLLPIFCLLPLKAAGILGGGDVKLLSVAGSFLGVRAGLFCVFLSFLIGAVLSVFLMIRRGIFKARICFFLNYIQAVVRTGKWSPYYDTTRDGYQGTMHFSTAVMLAVGVALWYCR